MNTDYKVNPSTGGFYSRAGGSGPDRKKGSQVKKTTPKIFNILDLLEMQNRPPLLSAGGSRKKSSVRNINPNEHRAHSQKPAIQPMPQGTGLQLPTFGNVADYLGQAGQMVNPEYDAAIQAIKALQSQTSQKAEGNQGKLGAMYNQLSQYFTTDAQKAAGDIYNTAQTSVATQGNDARNSVAQTYAAMQAQQQKEAEQLGIQGLGLQDEMAEQNSDRAFIEGLMAKDTAAVQGNLSGGQQSLQNYNQASGNVAKLEGGEQQAALMQQLQDYLAESNAQIGGIEGQRASALQQMAMELADRDYKQRMDAFGMQQGMEDREWDREMALMQLEAQMAEAQARARSAGSAEKPEDPWSKVAEFAERSQPGYGKNIMAVLQGNMNDDELQKLLNNRAQPVNPASFARYFNSQNKRGTGADSRALNSAAQYLFSLLYGKG